MGFLRHGQMACPWEGVVPVLVKKTEEFCQGASGLHSRPSELAWPPFSTWDWTYLHHVGWGSTLMASHCLSQELLRKEHTPQTVLWHFSDAERTQSCGYSGVL